MGKTKTPEGAIKSAIMEYLFMLKHCMVWVNASVGIYDPVRKTFRKNNSKYQRNGVPDILGIYRGVPLAIEVKTKSGKVSKDQHKFLDEFQAHGGLAFVARSVDEVVLQLKSFDLVLKNRAQNDTSSSDK